MGATWGGTSPFLEVPPTSRHHHPCHQLSLSLRTQLEWLFSCQPVFPSPDIHLKSQAKQPAVADRLSQILVPLAKFRYVWPWFSRGFCISFPETLRPVSVMRISLLGSYESLPWSGLHSVAGTLSETIFYGPRLYSLPFITGKALDC